MTRYLGVLGHAGRVHRRAAGRERRYETSEARFARAVAQLDAVGSVWDSRLARTRRIAETIQRSQQQ